MTILLVQIFSLMLGAFLLGACLACLLRRGLSGARDVPVAETGLASPAGFANPASVAAPAGVATGRFGRALSGGDGSSVPTVLRTDQPVVEVQPPPSEPEPLPHPDLVDREVLEPMPAVQPAPASPAPPWRAMRPPPPALASDRGPILAPAPAAPAAPTATPPEPAQDHGQSYTQIAVGAAAAAAAIAAAKARADAEAAERDVAETEAAQKAAAAIAAAQARADAEAAERQAAERAAAEKAAAERAAAKARAEAEAAEREAAERETAERAAAERAAARARAEAETAEREAAEKAAAERAAAEIEAPAPSELAAPQEGADWPSRFGTPAATSLLERLAGEPVDDLTRIHGIDGALKQRLVRYGVHRFSQIAAWTAGDVWGTSRALALEDRVRRDNWIEQARILAEGGDPSPPRAEKPPVAVGLAPVDGDRLNRIIGIDPAAETLLRANGVTRLAEIAAWQGEDVARFEALLGTNGRIAREGWVAQALFLTGDAPPASEPDGQDPGPIAQEGPELSQSSSEPRESYAGLLSVRSEALRGDTRPFVTSAGEVQDLKRIRGIGVLIEKRLNALGITAYEQVANWTRADIDRISEMLDFKGRIERENWIEQARILASGGQTEFSRRVDRGDA